MIALAEFWGCDYGTALRLPQTSGRVLAEYFAADIRPEFLHFVGHTIPHDEHSPRVQVSGQRAVFRRMVNIGDSAGHGIANNLREIESGVPGVGSRDEQPAYRVERPVTKSPFPPLVIPRIFAEDAGEDSGRHVGPDAIVGEGGSVAFPISSPSLPPGFRGVVHLADRGERANERVGEIVEHSG